MDDLVAIPCLFMRGGTSRGPYFRLSDLPADTAARDRVLLAAMGSPDVRQIDGLGGADTLTSKVAMVSPSDHPGVDVDYLFAQVSVDKAIVDTSPSCGNMLAGVGPFAIERGMTLAVIAPDGREIAHGMSSYDSSALSKLCGAKSSQIAEILGYSYGDAAIHRNNLVLLV